MWDLALPPSSPPSSPSIKPLSPSTSNITKSSFLPSSSSCSVLVMRRSSAPFYSINPVTSARSRQFTSTTTFEFASFDLFLPFDMIDILMSVTFPPSSPPTSSSSPDSADSVSSPRALPSSPAPDHSISRSTTKLVFARSRLSFGPHPISSICSDCASSHVYHRFGDNSHDTFSDSSVASSSSISSSSSDSSSAAQFALVVAWDSLFVLFMPSQVERRWRHVVISDTIEINATDLQLLPGGICI